MKLGSAWYPEHWDETRWPEDLALMRAAGMNVVRVGEFAWSRMEPAEGQYDFDWLQRAIELAKQHGMETVIGTPTAAPPAWLTHNYPDTLAIRENGRPDTHGNRCHFNPASPRYLDFCRKIAEQMAQRFGQHPDVIGWQICNEYNSVSYDEETRRQFQAWLRERYGTLDALNARWSTAYWSQTYSDWAQIPLPIGGHNPGLMLDFRRFITHIYVHYQRVQLDAIRAHTPPDRWITSNFMGWFDRFDHYAICEDLDLASWDNYVGTGHLNFLNNGAVHDLTRGFKRKNFWIMETQPGSVNWSPINNMLNRGEVRAMAWHAIGHGADAVLYWQWRSALNGQEQYHGSLVAPDGNTRPLYTEITQLGRDMAQAAAALRDTRPVAECAVLHSYDNRWAIDFQRHHRDFQPVEHWLSFYRPLRTIAHTVDVINPDAPLKEYRLVVAPHLHMIDEVLAAKLTDYVRNGGHLVLGPRSGMKDIDNSLLPARQPGPLAPTLGAHVEEYYALDTTFPVSNADVSGSAKIWAEWLVTDTLDAQIIMRYGTANGWLDGQAAVVTRVLGAGRITYVGAWLDADTMKHLATSWALASGLDTFHARMPEGVEMCRRVGEKGEALIVINHTRQPQEIPLPYPARDLLTGEEFGSRMILSDYQVAVLVSA